MALVVLVLSLFSSLFLRISHADISCKKEIDQNITTCISYQKNDIIILNDVSCPMPTSRCLEQQKEVAAIMRSVKGVELDKAGILKDSRVGYIEFDDTEIFDDVNLVKYPYNAKKLNITEDILNQYSSFIMNRGDCSNSLERNGNPRLSDAINSAFAQFDEFTDQRDKFIIIYSSCAVDVDHMAAICRRFEDTIQDEQEVDIFMVNNGDIRDDYILCLVEYDPDRIFGNPKHDHYVFYHDIITDLSEDVCSPPTPAPTTDPTEDPTTNPTASPERITYDIDCGILDGWIQSTDGNIATSGYVECGDDTPCIRLKVEVEAFEDIYIEREIDLTNARDVVIGYGITPSQLEYNLHGDYAYLKYKCDDDEFDFIQLTNEHIPESVDINDTLSIPLACNTLRIRIGLNVSGGMQDQLFVRSLTVSYIEQEPSVRRRRMERTGSTGTTTRRRRSRNLLHVSDTHDGCITLKMQIELENLLPTNNNPDAFTNIAMIAKGTAVTTGSGSIRIDQYDDEFDETTTTTTSTTPAPVEQLFSEHGDHGHIPNQELNWGVTEECRDQNQVKESYWPREPYTDELSGDFEFDADTITITYPFQTPPSIVSVIKMDQVTLPVGNSCPLDFTWNSQIFLNGDAVSEVATVVIAGNDESTAGRVFKFDGNVRLTQNTSYDIQFTGNFSSGCDETNLIFSSGAGGRRLLDDYVTKCSLTSDAEPDSCTLGNSLAKSEEMKAGIRTMCDKSNTDTRPKIEESLFKHHASQSAIKNHLVATGSLHIYDSDGKLIRDIAGWPKTIDGKEILEPCVAIDDTTSKPRVYSIGGRLEDGTAVDTITVYEFENGTLNSGKVVQELEGWTLDKPRYGAMCIFYKNTQGHKSLIVISGMVHKKYEFKARSWFHKDIRKFEIPPTLSDLRDSHNGANTYSVPEVDKRDSHMQYNLIDAKPFIMSTSPNILYLFGGKTHEEAKAYIQSVAIDDIAGGNATFLNAMDGLKRNKALPLIDVIRVDMGTGGSDIQDCYMVFAGVTYEGTTAIDVETDNLQLFCNEVLGTGSTETTETTVLRDRRRTINDDIVSLTEFDKQMLLKSERRRRLSDDTDHDDEESQIFIRKYKYENDGIWYAFNVTFDLCYDTNDEVNNAELLYQDIIDDKPDGDDWITFTDQVSMNILEQSKKQFEGWSFGFGDVRVNDLDIMDVHYIYPPSPTKKRITHPQRRKARSWWKNIEEIDSGYDDNIWIDSKYDSDDSDSD